MSPILWESCRRQNGTLLLEKAANMTGCKITPLASEYLMMVERLAPITSRQVAAVAIATALEISAREQRPQLHEGKS